MAEPPFQMPGHRWDPDKKRFFKILPGQIPSSSSGSDTASGSARKRSRKGKQREVPPHGEHLFSNACLPAIDIRTPAQKLSNFKSAFQEVTSDPVALRQLGRLPLTSRQISTQPRIEATYSHLALCTARTPFRMFEDSTGIVGVQSDTNGHSLIVCDRRWVVRSYPTHGHIHLFSDTRPMNGTLETSSMWRGSELVWFVHSDSKGVRRGISTMRLPPRAVSESIDRNHDRQALSWISEFATMRDLEQEFHMSSCGEQAWTFVEVIDEPRDARPAGTRNRARQPGMEGRRGRVLYAFSVGKRVKTLAYRSSTAEECPSLIDAATVSFASDVMALAFDASGEALYCGTRCGLVAIWRYPSSSSAMIGLRRVMAVDANGSVTNLAVVSASELLIVRINGTVQLVDATTGEIRQRYRGHVNSYHYKLAFAIDKESRIFALAGLDRRVRVWSFDSPLPLGTSTTFLPPVYHPPEAFREGQRLVNQSLFDQSEGEAFISAHCASNGDYGIRKGSTLSTIVFPQDPSVLHWHPRYAFEGIDPYEAEAIRQGQGDRYCYPRSQWKDLFVAVGDWLYQFRFP